MSEKKKRTLIELGIAPEVETPIAPIEEAPAEEVAPVAEPTPEIDEEAVKARFEELTGKKPRANAKIETLIATIAELE